MTAESWHRLSFLPVVFLLGLACSSCQLFVEDFPPAASSDSLRDAATVDAAIDVVDASEDSAQGQADAEDAASKDAGKEDVGQGNSCDEDGDGHKAMGSCGGDDCDDTDPDVFPGQQKFFVVRNKRGNFDYDCDNQETPYPAQAVENHCSAMSCNEKLRGYLDHIPKCGEAGKWGTCRGAMPPQWCQEVVEGHPLLACR